MNRWRLIVLMLRRPDRVSRALVRKLDRLPARGKVYKPLDREAKRPGPTGVPPGQRQILDALADAPLKPFDIAARIGRTPGAIRATLGVMREAGRVVRLPDGTYQCASRACEGIE